MSFNTLLQRNKIFIPYFMLGYPNYDSSLALIKTAIDSGARALELGLPFSDPIADGATIQEAGDQALQNGMTFHKALSMLQEIRKSSDIPMAFMTYCNPLYRIGYAHAYQLLANSGINAVLVVDNSIENAEEHTAFLQQHHLQSIYLIAPNTPLARAQQIMQHSSAFSYVISVDGTTGARDHIEPRTIQRLQQLSANSTTPLVVGFGISTPQQVTTMLQAGANGVIIASQLVKLIQAAGDDQHQQQATVATFMQQCNNACNI